MNYQPIQPIDSPLEFCIWGDSALPQLTKNKLDKVSWFVLAGHCNSLLNSGEELKDLCNLNSKLTLSHLKISMFTSILSGLLSQVYASMLAQHWSLSVAAKPYTLRHSLTCGDVNVEKCDWSTKKFSFFRTTAKKICGEEWWWPQMCGHSCPLEGRLMEAWQLICALPFQPQLP